MFLCYAFNKLVRSFLLEDAKLKKYFISYKILTDDQYKNALMDKLREETTEVITANNKHELINEIADCYEVIDEIIKVHDISKQDILSAQRLKKEQKGGFEKKIFVTNAQYDDQSPLHQSAFDYIKDERHKEKYKLIGEYDKHIVDFIITNDAKDKIYIQKRSSTRKVYPNSWELPGGSLEASETIEECLARELKEELNLGLLKINNIIYEADEVVSLGSLVNDQKCRYTVFAIEVTGWENFKLEEGKADEFKWISRDEIEILNIHKENDSISPVYKAVKKYFFHE